ncbi:hypothetical protein MPRG_35390 [Mycobacterium paragordonae]|uniref:Sulfatase-modifying factor enzyme-like domain-containing protein n=1 Tax=Mycobacterium paragordonae TaxID=1389713 RepID=A0ABQ1C732_9MYCO|nr:hypothetical protein MPRG_35390 [Mycobacterium paragordonae]
MTNSFIREETGGENATNWRDTADRSLTLMLRSIRRRAATEPNIRVPRWPGTRDVQLGDEPERPRHRLANYWRKVVKGGSFLCADSYCRPYRPAGRRPQPIDTGMSHIGFRCIVRPPSAA